MKTLGRTDNGGFIVEMSQEENIHFVRLHRAVSGSDRDYIGDYSAAMDGEDLSPVFKALNDMFSARISINALKEAVNRIDSLLGGTVFKVKS